MADKAISDLVAAEQITATDMFVLEQNNTAKKLTGQILLNWLTKAADGHGGISSIAKQSTSGLTDTYRITLADTTTFDFPVTNGMSIFSIAKIGSSGLTDTYKISYNDGTYTTFPVTNGRGIKSWTESVSGLTHTYTITYNDNTTTTLQIKDGEKGDKGDNSYIWIKYASQEPTVSSHSMSDIPDNWIGVYSGNSATAPTDWQQYKWFQYKGEKGDTGAPAVLNSSKVEYQVSDSGTIIPSGSWSTSVPVVAQGKYLWTRTTQTYNTGDPVVSYSVSRMGLDGSGSVSSVANISPESDGNVPLTAGDVGALADTGGDITGELRMNGQPISGLNPPAENTQAANKGYVDESFRKAAPNNLLDNSDFRDPVNQRGKTSYTGSGYTIDRWENDMGLLTVSVADGSVKVQRTGSTTDNFKQTVGDIHSILGKTVTFALKADGDVNAILGYTADGHTSYFDSTESDGVFIGSCTVPENAASVELYIQPQDANACTLYWAALYEGEYTADTLPIYKPKGYGAELAECQRYYYRVPGDGQIGYTGYIFNATTSRITIPLPVPMRITPTLAIATLSNANLYPGGVTPSNITVVTAQGNACALTCTGEFATTGIPAVLRFNTTVSLSADL